MSKSDKTALLKVVKGRFELLQSELHRREIALRRQITEQVNAENAAALKKYHDALDAIEEEARAISKKARVLSEEARKDGIALVNYRDHGGPFTYTVYEKVEVQNAMAIVDDRIQEIKSQGTLNGGLRELELKITEQLLVMDLETDDAKNFMDEIPRLDDVLPLPPEQKSITQ